MRADDLPEFYRAVLALPNPVHRDYLLLLLFTGLRRGEAATLAWTNVDFGQRVIRIPAARTKAGRKLDLPMSDIVHDLLVARRGRGRRQVHLSVEQRERPCRRAEVSASAGGGGVRHRDQRT